MKFIPTYIFNSYSLPAYAVPIVHHLALAIAVDAGAVAVAGAVDGAASVVLECIDFLLWPLGPQISRIEAINIFVLISSFPSIMWGWSSRNIFEMPMLLSR